MDYHILVIISWTTSSISSSRSSVFFACSCVCSCAYLWHALLFYVLCLVFHLSRCIYVMSDVFVLFACFVALQFRWFSACDAALCVIAIYGKLPNLETSLFGSCMLCCVYVCDAYALPNSAHALFA